ncbi:hypothetical protein CLV70_116101 [Pseudosporangium ferrugineum]|uniref:Uncharacterized protein n=1 Tax=Pseudosporangium ferrugineum TaxID=439699 RepID=A0A2T0RNW8_9ACTN|nr:hypothetical protein CLV70_116101 [Pseudosporangium ferrugineum]
MPFRVVSPAGTVLASGQANASATGNQIVPRVAVDPDGPLGSATGAAFAVVWEEVLGSAVTVYTGTATKAYEKVVSQTAGAVNSDPGGWAEPHRSCHVRRPATRTSSTASSWPPAASSRSRASRGRWTVEPAASGSTCSVTASPGR